jgi:hypothetical protein
MLDIVKQILSELLNSDDIIEKYEELLKEKPNEKLLEIAKRVDNPKLLLKNIHHKMGKYLHRLKCNLPSYSDTSSYLITSPSFEKTFNLKEKIDKQNLLHKKEYFTSLTDENFSDLEGSMENDMKRKSINTSEDGEDTIGCGIETKLLMFKRWRKLDKDFIKKKNG